MPFLTLSGIRPNPLSIDAIAWEFISWRNFWDCSSSTCTCAAGTRETCQECEVGGAATSQWLAVHVSLSTVFGNTATTGSTYINTCHSQYVIIGVCMCRSSGHCKQVVAINVLRVKGCFGYGGSLQLLDWGCLVQQWPNYLLIPNAMHTTSSLMDCIGVHYPWGQPEPTTSSSDQSVTLMWEDWWCELTDVSDISPNVGTQVPHSHSTLNSGLVWTSTAKYQRPRSTGPCMKKSQPTNLNTSRERPAPNP